MGCLVSKGSDMATELEQELDETNRYTAHKEQGVTFGPTTLLAADEVVCLNVIGEGPSGVMYKGTYRGSSVAVKKMKMTSLPLKQSAWETMEMALEVEAKRMGSLRHPNTVLFMGAYRQGEYFCIVSEYCSRGSLYNVLHSYRPTKKPNSPKDLPTGNEPKKKALKWSLRLRLALGAARGLLYLHSADPPLIHGQLKSTNILVDDSWNAKLSDFGTRRVVEAVGFDKNSSSGIDQVTTLLRWTAPELLKLGEEKVLKGSLPPGSTCPQAVDVYSFGMIMWELTTGDIPFADMTSNQEIRQHVLEGLRPMMKPGKCHLKWAELMARCWAQNAARRPSATEIVSTLESISKEDALKQSVKKQARAVAGPSGRPGANHINRPDYKIAANRMHTKTKLSSSNIV